jgi:phage major head subunit gpT-like protein
LEDSLEGNKNSLEQRMKTFKITCKDCGKTISCLIKGNEGVFANLKRGYKAQCYDCENKKWWTEERAGKHKNLSLGKMIKEELNSKVINFI